MKKKIMVTLNETQFKSLQASKELGDTDSERLRNSFILYNHLKDLLELIHKMKD